MAVIEHRTQEGVLGAFEASGMTKFVIWQGNEPIMVYDEQDPDFEANNNGAASDKLSQYLNFIQSTGTSAIYKLRVYTDDVKSINAKTPPRAVTRFQLSPTDIAEYKQTPDGKMMLIRQQPAPGGNNTALTHRLDNLEQTNRELLERLHQAEIKRVEQNFQHQIAGLTQQQQDAPDVWTRIGESLLEKPDNLDKALGHLKDIIGMALNAFRPNKNFITNQPPAPAPSPVSVNGTNVKEPVKPQEHEEEHEDPEQPETLQVPLTEEGAYINPFLDEQQRALKKSKRFPLMQEALSKLTPEELDEQQMICVEILENRITPVMLTHLLIEVACMDNDDLNSVINNLA